MKLVTNQSMGEIESERQEQAAVQGALDDALRASMLVRAWAARVRVEIATGYELDELRVLAGALYGEACGELARRECIEAGRGS